MLGPKQLKKSQELAQAIIAALIIPERRHNDK